VNALVRPVPRLEGRLSVPGDKSVSHRAALLGAVATGVTEVQGLLEGEDCLRTLRAVAGLGAEVTRKGPGHYMIQGVGLDRLTEPDDVIDCGNSGTTARLLLGILAGQPFTAFLTGDESFLTEWRDLRAVLFVPDLRLPTAKMRSALPAKVPLDDAVANLTRVAIGVAGMATGRSDLLRVLMVDRLHEPYRAAVYPQLPQLVEAARKAGAIGACLSGAGSAILAFSDSVRTITRIEAAFGAAAADTDLTGHITVVSPRNHGAQVIGRA